MWKSRPGNFNPLSAIALPFKTFSAQLVKSIAQKQLVSTSLLTVLGIGGVSWMATTAIAPQKVQAYTARVEVALNRQSDEPYESFMRRVEAVARAAVQRSFDSDILVTDVAVTILGQNNGAIAPVMLLQVSRQSWRSSPDSQQWATYFPDSQSLLGFEPPGAQPTGTPPFPQPVPPPQTFPQPAPAPETFPQSIPAPATIESPGVPNPIQAAPPPPPPDIPPAPIPEATPLPPPGIPGATTP